MNKDKTICITTVCSRSLTTLFASCCHLHPNIVTLNHFPSINTNKDTNFLVNYTPTKIDNFFQIALDVDKKNLKIPGEGGSILASHAFSEKMLKIYNQRYKNVGKPNVNCIVWKDSSRNMKYLKKNIDDLIAFDDRFRFILVLREPLDCATSNTKPGYNSFFKSNNKYGVLEELFEGYNWFFTLKNKYDDNFKVIYEYNIDDDSLFSLENFLNIKHDNRWVKDFKKNWNIRKHYNHEDKFIEHFKKLINKYDFQKDFERFIK